MQPDPGPRSFIAQDIAEAFSEATGADRTTRAQHLMVAFTIGEHLATLGKAGQWEHIDPEVLLDQILVHEDLERFCFDALWMFLYMELHDLVSPRAVVRLINGFATHGPKTKRLTLMLHDAIKTLRAQNPGSAAIPVTGMAQRPATSTRRKFR